MRWGACLQLSWSLRGRLGAVLSWGVGALEAGGGEGGSAGEEDRRLGADVGGDSLYGEGSQEGEDAGLEASGS